MKSPLTPLKNVINRRKPQEIFVTFVALSLAVYIFFSLIYLIFGENLFANAFFHNGEDLFMDFFNSLRDLAQGNGVYTERHVIYPPLANLLFLPFLPILPAEYLNTSYDDRMTWMNYTNAYYAIILFIALFAIVFFFFLAKNVKVTGRLTFLFSIFLVINEPVLFAVERGNILLFAIVAVNFFMLHFESQNKVIKELTLIALGFAVGLKLYPALFALVLLTNKKYKELIRLVIYSLIFLIVPCFFFGGLSVFVEIIKNIFIFMGQRSDGGEGELGTLLGILIKVATISVCLAAFIYTLVFAFKKKDCEKWKIFTLIVCLIEFTLPLHSIYVWCFTIAPLLMFIKEKPTLVTKNDCLYFTFLFLPYLISASYILPVPTLINEGLLIVSQIGFTVLTMTELKKAKKEQ